MKSQKTESFGLMIAMILRNVVLSICSRPVSLMRIQSQHRHLELPSWMKEDLTFTTNIVQSTSDYSRLSVHRPIRSISAGRFFGAETSEFGVDRWSLCGDKRRV